MPAIGDGARWLFVRDDSFRELCEEYLTCEEAARRMEDGPGEDLRREYATLLLRIEAELLRYVAKRNAGGA
jgi:hypothetical protein